jgi:ribosome biogenesis GTPase / thiamine phosphate phosphatase
VKAIVYKSTGSWYIVKDEQGKCWNGRTKGVMKLDDITSTNPIAVGDWVACEVENEESNSVIIDGITTLTGKAPGIKCSIIL